MSVKLSVYDITGRLVTTLVNRIEDPGAKTVNWNGRVADGSEISNGVYFYRLETDKGTFVQKIVYTR
jgi:flagellar hook assembly protein FlgD